MSAVQPANGFVDTALPDVIVPVLTPLTADERVDALCSRFVARRLVEAGVDHLFLLGSCGEGPCLLEEDRRELVESVVGEIAGRATVIVGVSESSTARAIRAAAVAEAAGADAMVSTFPHYYAAASQHEVELHFRALADATSLPVLVYNIPQMAKSVIEPETVGRLARVKNIVGIKDSSGDWAGFQKMLARRAETPGFRVFQGEETLMGPSLLAGADGIVPATANLAPRLFLFLVEAARNGDRELVSELQERIDELTGLYHMDIHWLAALKAAAGLLGLCGKTVSRPICAADSAAVDRIRRDFLPDLLDPLRGILPEHVAAAAIAADERQSA